MNVTEKVKASMKTAVHKAVAAGNHSRWGEAESVACIEALVDLLVNDEDVASEGFDAIREQVAALVNPSAFAQRLEKRETSDPAHIRRTKGSSRKADLF